MRTRLGCALAAVLAVAPALRSDPPAAAPKPKLAVLIVFDQMRGDYVQKWSDLFVADGFRRLQTEGAWFTNCNYPYSMTSTGPGHASMLSGCSGDRHGIVANNWYDRKEGAAVYCATYPHYERIPPLPPKADEPKPAKDRADEKKDTEEGTGKGFGAPVRMLAPTLGDTIKEATHGRGKVFGLSLKDRSALLPAGKHPDGAYWFDKGQFVTSTYYGDRLHPWVAKFNREKSFDRWFGQKWDRFNPKLDYEKFSGKDDVAGEDSGFKQGRSFPHPFGTAAKLGSEYYSALSNSPFGNEVLLELACRCVEEEHLGLRDVPDLLTVSFSSNDLIGHCWGPDSQEVLDVTLRSDLIVRDFLKFLDAKVGRGNYVVGLTADHGICPLPEVTRSHGQPADRLLPLTLTAAAEEHLRGIFGEPSEKKTRWIEIANEGGIYLNPRLVASRGTTVDAVSRELATWLARQPNIHAAYARPQLVGEMPAADELGRRVQKCFHPERSGDVIVVLKPYYLLTSKRFGTSHGTPHPYDRHVPLMVLGPGVHGGPRSDPVTPQAVAAILARAIGVPTPAKAEAPVPAVLFE